MPGRAEWCARLTIRFDVRYKALRSRLARSTLMPGQPAIFRSGADPCAIARSRPPGHPVLPCHGWPGRAARDRRRPHFLQQCAAGALKRKGPQGWRERVIGLIVCHALVHPVPRWTNAGRLDFDGLEAAHLAPRAERQAARRVVEHLRGKQGDGPDQVVALQIDQRRLPKPQADGHDFQSVGSIPSPIQQTEFGLQCGRDEGLAPKAGIRSHGRSIAKRVECADAPERLIVEVGHRSA